MKFSLDWIVQFFSLHCSAALCREKREKMQQLCDAWTLKTPTPPGCCSSFIDFLCRRKSLLQVKELSSRMVQWGVFFREELIFQKEETGESYTYVRRCDARSPERISHISRRVTNWLRCFVFYIHVDIQKLSAELVTSGHAEYGSLSLHELEKI